MSLNDETTVSCNFEFFEKYLRNAKDMMNNRVCLLIDYENANRNLEKAKTGSKRQAVSAIFGLFALIRLLDSLETLQWRVYRSGECIILFSLRSFIFPNSPLRGLL